MIPDWAFNIPLNLIRSKASDLELDPYLVAAMVNQESRGKACAVRYEPHFRWLVTPEIFAKQNDCSVATEEVLQKTSFGLMQLMGGTARGIGFTGDLCGLLKPETNLYWGCKFLKRLKSQYPDMKDMVAAYNAGSPRKEASGEYENQKYVDGVMKFYRELKG